jgi:pimeloyl-ACP methyl ester carboxylesterase
VIVGNEDVVTPPALSVELAGLVPRAQLAIVEGAGHLANLEKPELFNRALDDFIAGVE